MYVFPFKLNQRKCICYYRPGAFCTRMAVRWNSLEKKYLARLYIYADGTLYKASAVMRITQMLEELENPALPVLLIARGNNAKELLADVYEYLLEVESWLDREKRERGNNIGHPEWIDEPPEISVRLSDDSAQPYPDDWSPQISALGGWKERFHGRLSNLKIERRREQCSKKLTKGISICPECGIILKPTLPYQEFEILVKVAMLPDSEFRKVGSVRVSTRTSVKKLIMTLHENGFIRPGEYELVRTFRDEADCPQPQFATSANFGGFCAWDVVFLRRSITVEEKEKAHQRFIDSHHMGNSLHRTCVVSVKLFDVELLPYYFYKWVDQDPRNRTIQLEALGMMGKDDVFRMVQQAGYDPIKYMYWPSLKIPFEDGNTSVEALVCEMEDNNTFIKDKVPIIIKKESK